MSTAAPTWEIWKYLMPRVMDYDPRKAFVHHEDFALFPRPATNTTSNAKDWVAFLSDGGGSEVVDSGDANVSGIKISADGDNEAVVFTRSTAPIRITQGSTRKVAFETRFKTSTIADTKHGLFFGLFEVLVPTATSHIAAAGTLTDKNFIGFHRLEGDGDQIDVVYKADGQTQQSFIDALTLVADTFTKVGFIFDGVSTIKFYLAGLEYATAQLNYANITAVTFPSDINLTPALALVNATASTPGTTTIDWVRFGYTFGDTD